MKKLAPREEIVRAFRALNRPLKTLRVRNFKAIHDSGTVKLTPLTVLIGNNGVGKSSLIEALFTLRTCILQGLDSAMHLWRGIEHVRNKSKKGLMLRGPKGQARSSKPIRIDLRGTFERDAFSLSTAWNERRKENELFIEQESYCHGDHRLERDWGGKVDLDEGNLRLNEPLQPGLSALASGTFADFVRRWQFLELSPQAMGQPYPRSLARKTVELAPSGANVAELLLEIFNKDRDAFAGILEAIQHVLPYVRDFQATETTELERTVYLQLSEKNFKVPGWLLSTGTLRLVALLALLRHPHPPSLLLIEEIENGLDPQAISMLVEEIKASVDSGRTQIVMTTHSPYLLDRLPLSSIVLVDRVDDAPRFIRPAGEQQVQEWAKTFDPGRLYTMGRLRPSKR